mmetsp:Transcript_36816/g.89169  ORF Transcript_36816/g.89169 Transcript_36816/m.89169 type:complete len:492 (+) Transcript_36816:71-1546(+)
MTKTTKNKSHPESTSPSSEVGNGSINHTTSDDSTQKKPGEKKQNVSLSTKTEAKTMTMTEKTSTVPKRLGNEAKECSPNTIKRRGSYKRKRITPKYRENMIRNKNDVQLWCKHVLQSSPCRDLCKNSATKCDCYNQFSSEPMMKEAVDFMDQYVRWESSKQVKYVQELHREMESRYMQQGKSKSTILLMLLPCGIVPPTPSKNHICRRKALDLLGYSYQVLCHALETNTSSPAQNKALLAYPHAKAPSHRPQRTEKFAHDFALRHNKPCCEWYNNINSGTIASRTPLRSAFVTSMGPKPKIFDKFDENSDPPKEPVHTIHKYGRLQAVNLSAFEKQYDEVPMSNSVMIDILKHGSSGVPLKECVDYGEHEFLLKSQEWAMERIYHNPVLLVKAIESNGTLPKDTKRSLVDEIDNIWTSNETLENKKKKLKAWATAGENSELFFGTLNAASYHEGTPIDDITIYPEHRDTVNGLVMFQQVSIIRIEEGGDFR